MNHLVAMFARCHAWLRCGFTAHLVSARGWDVLQVAWRCCHRGWDGCRGFKRGKHGQRWCSEGCRAGPGGSPAALVCAAPRCWAGPVRWTEGGVGPLCSCHSFASNLQALHVCYCNVAGALFLSLQECPVVIIAQKKHWVKEVIIRIAKSNTQCSEIPEIQPEQVECMLQITGSCNGNIWEISALVLPVGLSFSPSPG